MNTDEELTRRIDALVRLYATAAGWEDKPLLEETRVQLLKLLKLE